MSIAPEPYYATPTRKLLNLDGDSLSSNQEGVAHPWGHGANPYAVTWVDEAYRQRAEKVTNKVKKGKDVVIGHNIFADVIGVAKAGRARHLRAIIVNEDIVWQGAATFAGSAELSVSVPGIGDFYVSPGADDQAQDTRLVPYIEALSGRHYHPGYSQPEDNPEAIPPEALAQNPGYYTGGLVHPAYQGLVRLVVLNLFCGFEVRAVPSVKLVLDSLPEIWTSEATNVLSFEGANPVYHLAKAVEDPLSGLDAPHILDQAEFVAAATLARRRVSIDLPPTGSHYADWGHQAPLLTAPVPFLAHAASVLAYFDGYLRLTSEGKLGVGVVPRHLEEPEGLPVLDVSALAGPVSGPQPVPAASQKNVVKVNHRDRALLWKTTAAVKRNRAHIRRHQRENVETVDRANLITKHQADEQAETLAARLSGTQFAGSAPVLVSWLEANNIGLGSLFRLDYSPLSLSLVARVVGWRRSAQGRVDTIRFVQEPGLRAQKLAYAPPARPQLVPQPPAPLAAIRIYQPLKGWTGPVPSIIPFAARAHDNVVGATLLYSPDDTAYQTVSTQTNFALPVHIHAAALAADATLQIVADGIDTPLLIPQDPGAQLDDTLVLLVGDEVLSIGDIDSEPADVKVLHVLRARLGTAAADHAADAPAWVALRRDLPILQSRSFPADVATGYFRALPRTHYSELPLADADPIPHTWADLSVADPVNFQAIGLAGGFTLQFSVTDPGVIGARIWSALAVNERTDDPTFVYAISNREIDAGIVRIPYFDPDFQTGAPIYFWIQLFDDAPETNYSNLVGPITNRAFAIDGQGPSVEIVQSPDPASRPTPGPGRTFTLTAIVKNYFEAITYQWYRYPIDNPAGTLQLLTGQTSATLVVPHEDIIPSPSVSSPAASRRYRVVVNGYQWDEHTIQLGRPQEGDNRFWLRDEITTVYFNEDLTLRQTGDIVNRVLGTSSNFKITTDQWASVEAEAQDPTIGLGGPLKDHVFHLELPAELQFLPSFLVPNNDPKVRYSSVRLTALGKAALEGDLDDVSFPITVHAQYRLGDIDSAQVEDTAVLNWIVKKNVVVQETPTITMATTAPPVFEQPITPTIFYVAATFRRSFYEVFSTIARYSVDADGVITRLLTSYGIGSAIYDALGLENGLGAPASFFNGYYRAASGAPPSLSAEGDATTRVVVTATRSGATPVSLILQAEPDTTPPITLEDDGVGTVYAYSDTPATLHDISTAIPTTGGT